MKGMAEERKREDAARSSDNRGHKSYREVENGDGRTAREQEESLGVVGATRQGADGKLLQRKPVTHPNWGTREISV